MSWSSTAMSLGEDTAGAARTVPDVLRLVIPRADALRAPRCAVRLTLAMKSTPSSWSAFQSIQISPRRCHMPTSGQTYL